tara:strand:+ start:669 stop:944 length:276 start_codon:yes stop_codon:yes gene_type:complete
MIYLDPPDLTTGNVVTLKNVFETEYPVLSLEIDNRVFLRTFKNFDGLDVWIDRGEVAVVGQATKESVRWRLDYKLADDEELFVLLGLTDDR